MEKHEERKTYVAPTVEFHAAVQDIIMCSGNQYSGGGNGGNGGGGNGGGGNGGGNGGGWGWHWWPWG